MKIIFKILAILLAVMLVWYVAQMVASETGEVVVLTTTDSEGNAAETRLWVFDLNDKQYLRAGHSGAGWYIELLANASIGVVRDDISKSYTAVPAPELKELGNQLMRDKYGWRDAYISLFFSRASAIPVRLDPID